MASPCIQTDSNSELAIDTTVNVLQTLNTKLKITHPDLFARLPNELLEPILMRLEIHKLIPLRLVSSRWNVMIESICHKKQQSLALVSRHFEVNLKDRFDGQLNLSRLVYLKLKQMNPNLTVDLCTLLGKLFPRVEHLFVDRMVLTAQNFDIFTRLFNCWSASLVTLYFDGIIEQNSVTQVCSQINAMTNLRNLDLSNDNMLPLNSLAPTLEPNYGELFCQFFSTIFPNLERLIVHYQDPRIGLQIRPFLYLFKILNYHDILGKWRN